MPMPKSILIVDDDAEMRRMLADDLALRDEFIVHEAGTAADVLAHVERTQVDLVVLDVGLPDMDGFEVCKIMRRRGFNKPIVMLTGRSSDVDTILGLESGANDYVIKPFRVPVLLARIRTQFRQFEQSFHATLALGPFTFKPAQKMLVDRNDRKIVLTAKEAGILWFLHRAEGRFVSKDTLLNEVWGYNDRTVTTHTIETHIYRLRRKLGRGGGEIGFLVTESGGYRLLHTVDEGAHGTMGRQHEGAS